MNDIVIKSDFLKKVVELMPNSFTLFIGKRLISVYNPDYIDIIISEKHFKEFKEDKYRGAFTFWKKEFIELIGDSEYVIIKIQNDELSIEPFVELQEEV
jgi:hypothetical protein